jgi:ribosomal-protein-alanine N-acetyltransferase
MIDKSRWGEGLATEAARGIIQHARTELHLKRLICLIMPGNAASAAVAKKMGMALEREYAAEFGVCHIYSRALIGET